MFAHEIFFLVVCSFLLFFVGGHDMKSLALNFATTLLFFLPIAAYMYPEYAQPATLVVLVSLVLSLLVPPVGWRRPHPYSDDPSNVPYPRKSD